MLVMLHRCRNRYDTRNGREQADALSISATPSPLPPVPPNMQLPALPVIHGTTNRVVAPANGREAAVRWTERVATVASKPRSVQCGTRYPATITDYRKDDRLVSTHCEIDQLVHDWSGGQPFSDVLRPDASQMIWIFVSKEFDQSAE
ncbi:MAG: hypothetical protein IPJ38_16955 [Dechloromonas sp.]|uniref:Uncharacterized protein n=1 Tax=Candidatus Dechloromonas phosphorivorans TaxID=2899244 RepID=A0A935JYV1_9RHOO|nr:hypothetical protein [Candidatus Dechloromonas phosphorivorans]